MKIRELLDTPEHWCKGTFARARGRDVSAFNPEADSWCIIGAAMKCYDSDKDDGLALTLAVRRMESCLSLKGLPSWNDSATFAEVRALVETLDI